MKSQYKSAVHMFIVSIFMPFVATPNFQMLLPSSVETFHLLVKATGKIGLTDNICNFYMGYNIFNMYNSMNCDQCVFLAAKYFYETARKFSYCSFSSSCLLRFFNWNFMNWNVIFGL
jgi:hypothetical protein